jgi:hypothetical protein
VSLGKALLVSRLPEQANDTYGAFRMGSHDDLVSALGLAVLAAERGGRAGVWLV